MPLLNLPTTRLKRPRALPLAAVFSGRCTWAVNHPALPEPVSGDVGADLLFDSSRRALTITALVPLQVRTGTAAGAMTTTLVTLQGPGAGRIDRRNGQVEIELPLFLDAQAVDPMFEEDAHLLFALRTGRSGGLNGAALDAASRLTLVGRGVIRGGALGGSEVEVVVAGRLHVLR